MKAIPTHDGAKFRKPHHLGLDSSHLTGDEFAAAFKASEMGRVIDAANSHVFETDVNDIPDDPYYTQRHRNSWRDSLSLVISHEFLLWRRDRFRLKARLVQSTVMGLVVGTVFYKQANDPVSGVGVLYQSLLFIALGRVPFILPQIDNRDIVYKHQDANFYPSWVFVAGSSIANLPSSILDILLYGVVVFFLTGMAYNDGATILNFFIFLLLILLSAYATGAVFSVFSASLKDRSSAMGVVICAILVMVVFSGFTVQPDVIPP